MRQTLGSGLCICHGFLVMVVGSMPGHTQREEHSTESAPEGNGEIVHGGGGLQGQSALAYAKSLQYQFYPYFVPAPVKIPGLIEEAVEYMDPWK